MDYDALLFDNDGVLVDTEPLFLRATQQMLARIGIELSEAQYREISLGRGASVFELAHAHGLSSTQIEALRDERNQRYAEMLDAGVTVLEGVEATLEHLHGHHPMAVVTSAYPDHFERIHAQTGLMRFFEFRLASGDYAHHKPHPEPYLAAAERLGIAPHRCVAIEDTERGLRSASAAGMRCIVIPNALSKGADFSQAEGVLETMQALPDALRA